MYTVYKYSCGGDMYRRWIGIVAGIIVIVSSIIGYHYLQHNREMKIYNCCSTRAENYHKEYISVVVNQLDIMDKTECANKIVRKCVENDFGNVLFSYDISIPTELEVAVYLSEQKAKLGKEEFHFYYTQNVDNRWKYNIVDNPEQFKVQMEK